MATKNESKAVKVGDTPIDPDAPLLEVENLHVEFRIEDGTAVSYTHLTLPTIYSV